MRIAAIHPHFENILFAKVVYPHRKMLYYEHSILCP